jgi:hypothetical protein
MNPSMSLNSLFVGGVQWNDGQVAEPHLGGEAGEAPFPHAGIGFGTGLNVQEVELQLAANVDPYFRATFVLAIPGLEGVEIEEGILSLLTIPRVVINVGKLKLPFGRENKLHTHGLLTLDRSLVGQRFLAEEGLNDVAVDAEVLLPLPWFSEIAVAVDRGTNEVLYGSGKPDGFGLTGHWKNLWDLGDSASVELGASGLTGRNAFGGRSWAAGVDLTLKARGRAWRQWQRVVWQSEFMIMGRPGAPEDEFTAGVYSTLEVAPGRRFWFGGRFDAVGFPGPADARSFAATAIVALVPTEFSAVRLQYQHQWVGGGHRVDSLAAQLNFTIGAHPAHTY